MTLELHLRCSKGLEDIEDVITANPKWPISAPLIICLIVPPHNCFLLKKSKYQVVVREVDGVR